MPDGLLLQLVSYIISVYYVNFYSPFNLFILKVCNTQGLAKIIFPVPEPYDTNCVDAPGKVNKTKPI
jgi:hypothetical protein